MYWYSFENNAPIFKVQSSLIERHLFEDWFD